MAEEKTFTWKGWHKTDRKYLDMFAARKHEIWVMWSKRIAEEEKISEKRLERWKKLWIPFDKLSEEMKNEDRNLALKDMDIAESFARAM